MEDIKIFEPGEIVIQEGTKGKSAFIVLSGAGEVLKRSADFHLHLLAKGGSEVSQLKA